MHLYWFLHTGQKGGKKGKDETSKSLQVFLWSQRWQVEVDNLEFYWTHVRVGYFKTNAKVLTEPDCGWRLKLFCIAIQQELRYVIRRQEEGGQAIVSHDPKASKYPDG